MRTPTFKRTTGQIWLAVLLTIRIGVPDANALGIAPLAPAPRQPRANPHAAARPNLASPVSAGAAHPQLPTNLAGGVVTGGLPSLPRFAAGIPAVAAAAGDMDGDGLADLVVAGEKRISLLRSTGAGFAPPSIFPGPDFPTAIAIGDFDGDGHNDLAITDAAGDVAILRGAGNGDFSEPQYFAVGKNPSAVAIADFNGDGIADLAVANRNGNDISILIGKGDGTFESAVSVPTGYAPAAIVAADFTGRGFVDLATADSDSGDITILPGRGDGTFGQAASFAVGPNPSQLFAADFDEDGHMDLVVLTAGDQTARLFLNDGRGSFAPADSLKQISAIATGDYEGDGHSSVFVHAMETGFLQVYSAQGNGKFAAGSMAIAETAALCLAAGDFGLAAIDSSGTVSLMRGFRKAPILVNPGLSDPGPGTVTASVAGPTSSRSVAPTAASTGKHVDGVLIAGTLTASPNPATLGQTVTLTYKVGPDLVANVKFFDGFTEIGTVHTTSQTITLKTNLLQTGTHHITAYYKDTQGFSVPFQNSTTLTVNSVNGYNFDPLSYLPLGSTGGIRALPLNPIVGDFNEDGNPDLVFIEHYHDSYVSVLLGNGDGTYQAPISLSLPTITGFNNAGGVIVSQSEAFAIATADFNQDGHADLVISALNQGDYSNTTGIIVCLGHGTGQFQCSSFQGQPGFTNDNGTAQPWFITAADLNGDRIPDLVFAASMPGDDTYPSYTGVVLGVMIGNGDGTFQSATSYTVQPANPTATAGPTSWPVSLSVADLRNTGNADIAVAYYGSSQSGLAVLLGNGDGTFHQPVLYTTGLTEISTAVMADFNGDGKLDFVIGAYGNVFRSGVSSIPLSLLRGNGDGTFQAPSVFSGPCANANGGTSGIGIGDFNGDGQLDLLIANSGICGTTIGAFGSTIGTGFTALFGKGDGTFPTSAFIETDSVTDMSLQGGGSASTFGITTFPGQSMLVADLNLDGRADAILGGELLGNNPAFNPFWVVPPPASVVLQQSGGNFYLGVPVLATNPAGHQMTYTAIAAVQSSDENCNMLGTLVQMSNDFNNLIQCTVTATDQFTGSSISGVIMAIASPTVISLSSNANPSTLNQAVTLTASLTYGVGGVNIRSGTVDFYDGNTRLGTSAVSGGRATLTTPLLSSGAHFLTASFLANSNSTAATSAPYKQVVSPLYQNGLGTMTTGSLPLSASPGGLAVGDFNLDGKPDLAVVDAVNNAVDILISNGDGTFKTPVPYSVGGSPQFVTVSDFNGDGKLDLAVTNYQDGTISVLIGNGDGTFQTSVAYPAGTNPISIVSADFNGDGIADLATANSNSDSNGSTVTMLIGKGDGTFFTSPQLSISVSSGTTGAYPSNLATGDFNKDGYPDLVVSSGTGTTVLLNSAGLSFTAVNLTAIGAVAVADFDGDGNLDIAIGETIFYGNGHGQFPVSYQFNSQYPNAIAVGDFNGDGLPDLAASNYANNNVTVFLSNANRTFQQSPSSYAVSGASQIAMGDFNADGRADIAVGVGNSSAVDVFLGSGVIQNVLTASCGPCLSTQSLTLTATLSDRRATGSVTFYEVQTSGNVSLGSATVTNGAATLPVTLTTGTYTLLATYGGTTFYPSSSSPNLPLQVTSQTSAITITTQPTGRTILVDAQSYTSPQTFTWVVGSSHTIAVPSPQGTGTVSVFVSWSDGGAASHNVTTPATATTYNANFATQYQLTITANGGTVATNPSGTSFSPNTDVDLVATASYGYQFVNWSGPVLSPNFAETHVIMSGPESVTANFQALPTPTISWVFNNAPPSTAPYNSTFTVWASSTSSDAPTISVAGVCTFSSTGPGFGSVTMTSGAGTCTVTATDPANPLHFGASLSAATTATTAASAISLASSGSPSTLGQSVTLTASITPSTSGGMVTFYAGPTSSSSDVTVLGTSRLSNGIATFSTALLPSAASYIKAHYTGDSNDNASNSSAALKQTVNTLSGGAFGAATTLTAQTKPTSVIIADFNGDGYQDIAVGNNTSNSVSVFLGNGSGGFSSAINTSLGNTGTFFLVTGDFNGDGIPDLAVVQHLGAQLIILLGHSGASGKGDGTFTVKQTLKSSDGLSRPAGAVVVDYNMDGIPDIVLVDDGVNKVFAFQGVGDGTFTLATSFSQANTPFALAAADFNGDGIPDLVIGLNSTGAGGNGVNALTMLGKGDGTFTANTGLSLGSILTTLAVADFNGDGKPDIAAVASDGTVAVFLGGAPSGTSLTFPTTYSYSLASGPNTNCGGLAVGDVDGDGILDLVVANGSSGSITVLKGKGDGSFTVNAPTSLPGSANPAMLAVGSFNRNGLTDVVTVNGTSASPVTYLATLTGTTTTLASSQNPSTYGQQVTLTATVSPNTATGTVTFVDNSTTPATTLGTGTLTNGVATLQVSSLAVIPVDGTSTSLPRSLTASYGGDSLDTASTSPTFAQTVNKAFPIVTWIVPPPSAAGYNSTFTVSASTNTGDPLVYSFSTYFSSGICTMSGTTVTILSTSGKCYVYAQDEGNNNYGGDGTVGITTVVPTTISLASSANPSTQGQSVTLTATVTASTRTGKVTFYAGPTPNSSDATVLGTSTLSNGIATLSTALLPGGPVYLQARYPGDGTDGITSSVLAQTVNASPSTGFGAATTLTPQTNPTSVVIADFNGDGYQDMAIGNNTSNSVSVFLGNGSGGFGSAINTSLGGRGTFGLAAGDFDGDGKTDLAVVQHGGAQLIILHGNGDGTFTVKQTFTSSIGLASPTGAAVLDYDMDGIPDIVLLDDLASKVFVFHGVGDGTFAAPTSFARANTPTSVAAADFNGDGIPDLLVGLDSNSGNNVLTMLGNGDGTFTANTAMNIGSSVVSLAVADFNGDGIPDIAAVGNNAVVTVYLGGAPSGTSLTFPFTYTYNVSSAGTVAVGDFNGDGVPDLVVSNGSSGSITVLIGKGDGSFAVNTATSLPGSANPSTLAVGSFNRNGSTDIITANGTSTNPVTYLPGGDTTALTSSANPSTHGQQITLTARVVPNTVTGTVTFADNSTTPATTLGAVTLSSGTATLQVSSLAVGSHSLTAVYGGDTGDPVSASLALTQTVNKAAATVTLGNLSATYTGNPIAATATTNPAGLAVTFTYNSNSTVPTAAGSYSVVGTINDPTYNGSASGTLVIGKATATVTLGNLSATYTGNPIAATAMTNPAGLAVTFTYNSNSTAPTAAGSYSVVGTINDPNYSGSASGTLVIGKATATVILGNLTTAYTGNPIAATATTNPAGLAVTLTYNNSSAAPTAAGSYSVVGTINDPNYNGSASGTLVIGKATASVTLGNLSATYTGSPIAATATTNPAGLAVTFTYNSNSTAPTAAGSYSVVGTINDPNYSGSASGTLVIGKATATVILGNLTTAYTGNPIAATATTNPAGLAVTFTYNSNSTVPTAAGSYSVVGTINDPNYGGSASGTLVIGKATASVTLGNLSATYTGNPIAATATTNPAGLAVSISYTGTPINAGSYPLIATITDPNYAGSTTGSLVIAKAAASVMLANLSAIFSGSPIAAAATTNPPNLAVTFTYNGGSTAPTTAGSYTVIGTISDANYAGSATGTLVIANGSSQPADVTSQIKWTTTGFAAPRGSNAYTATMTITNIGTTPIAAPLQAVFTNVISGATLANATGTLSSTPYAGAPYITLPGSTPLAAGASVNVTVKFTYTGTAPISFVVKVLSGVL